MNRLILTLAVFTGVVFVLGFVLLPYMANASLGYAVILPGVLYFIFGFGLLIGSFWTWRLARPVSRVDAGILYACALAGLVFIFRMAVVTFF